MFASKPAISSLKFLCSAIMIAGPVDAQLLTKRLIVLHTNDVRAQLMPNGDNLGGAARRAAAVARIRKEGPVVLVDGGDAIAPSPLSSWDRGQTAIDVMDRMAYDGLTPGNREFDFGLSVLRSRRSQVDFPFLCANLRKSDGDRSPFTPWAIVDREGVRVGIFGVMGPQVVEIVSRTNLDGLMFEDLLESAELAVDAMRDAGVDVIIGIVHGSEATVLSLARELDQVDLFVAGGYPGLERVNTVPVRTELMDGTLVVTCPIGGTHLGRVDLTLAREGNRWVRARADARLIPLDDGVGGDPDLVGVVDKRRTAFLKDTSQEIGTIAARTREEQSLIIAELMRRHVDAEVGAINFGALSPEPFNGELKYREVALLVRYGDSLVKLQLTGKQLRSLITRSHGADHPNKQLAFARLDPDEGVIDGRPIVDSERYSIVTTTYLTEGGDGYSEFSSGKDIQRTGIRIRPLVVQALSVWKVLSVDQLRQTPKGIWRSGWSLEGAFNRNYIDRTTEAYRQQREPVSFLSGQTTVAWNAATTYGLGYDVGRNVYDLKTRAEFGQIGQNFGSLESSSDDIEVDITYRYRARGFNVDPFVAAGISTAFRRTEGRRPLLVRSSVGLQRQLTTWVTGRLGGRAQRDFVVNETDLGPEITLEAQARLRSDGRLTSRLRGFFGLTDRHVISVENHNTLLFPLAGSLSLAVRQNNFVYRVTEIRGVPVSGVAFRSDLTVGFVFGTDWKWY